jgi:type IV secretion system protein VirB4
MQLLPPLSHDPRVVAREKSAGQHLPYARHLDASTIELRDGMIMQIIRLDGLLFETADSDELNYRARLRDAMLQTIASSRFAVYHHVIRRKARWRSKRASKTASRANSTTVGGRSLPQGKCTSTICS